jgi:hypothetical protein
MRFVAALQQHDSDTEVKRAHDQLKSRFMPSFSGGPSGPAAPPDALPD